MRILPSRSANVHVHILKDVLIFRKHVSVDVCVPGRQGFSCLTRIPDLLEIQERGSVRFFKQEMGCFSKRKAGIIPGLFIFWK